MTEALVQLDSSPQLLDAAGLRRTTLRLAHEIRERHGDDLAGLVLAGVRTRGVPLAQRIAAALQELGGRAPRVAAIDTRGHRDDGPHPALTTPAVASLNGGGPPPIDGSTVIVVDDVIFTGRTLRAALDALMDQGRAAAIEVLVLVDRGHRELPLRANYVGKNVPTAAGDRVTVRLLEVDGVDGAWLVQGTRG